jgi:hypothetical protein
MGMWPTITQSPDVMLLRGQYQHFKKDHAKKNIWSDINSTHVFGRKTYCRIYANKQAKCNPPESVTEAITWIEIFFSKPVMHIDPCFMRHGNTLHIFPECWIVPPYKIYRTWSTEMNVWSIRNYWLPGNNLDCSFFKKGISQKLTKEI